MEGGDVKTTTMTPNSPLSPSSSSSPHRIVHLKRQSPPVVLSPCAACKILRRRCVDKCVLAPYFPPNDPLKFTTAHRVFGASNIIKLLQDLPENQRHDAVSSIVYEANARIRDPVYGCAGAIFQLQGRVSELQAQLAKTQAELLNLQSHQANLVAMICMEMANTQEQTGSPDMFESNSFYQTNGSFLEDNSSSFMWEPLWT